MCNFACLEFVTKALTPTDIANAQILEVGSYNYNGSFRQILETPTYSPPNATPPLSYLGVDITSGPGVDQITSVYDFPNNFPPDNFDIVIATELLEHLHDWRTAVINLKYVLKPGGFLIITTRSPGFPRHDYPSDYWRYTLDDFAHIFADMDILLLESDNSTPPQPGVFMKARKHPPALLDLDLYPVTDADAP